jgi:hypothetical protein
MNATTETRSSRKVLVPLATLLVAGAVAVGSGASFTSTTNSATAVTAGTLKHANSQNNKTLTIGNIKPGDVRTGTLTITNNGTLDSELSLAETGGTNFFEPGVLDLTITSSINGAAATTVFDGDFGAMTDDASVVIGDLLKDKVATITFTVTLDSNATNASQGMAATAGFRWVTTQKNDNSTLDWFDGIA